MNNRKRKNSREITDRNRPAKEPRIYHRLIRRVQIRTDAGLRYANALFDTGANIFMLDSKIANKLHIRQIKRLEPLEILGFSGTAVPSVGQTYAPFVRLVIDKHESFIACKIGTLEAGIHLIIPGGWFIDDHPITFDKGEIQVKTHECDKDEAFEWDDDLSNLDDPNAVLVGRIGAIAIQPTDNTENIPRDYEKYFHLFSEKTAAKLPPHQNFDHAIDIIEGKQPPFGPIYSLSQKALEVLREYLDRMIAQGKIQPSKSPAGAPILFVPKPNGKLRLCVDYRALIDVTIKIGIHSL